jgi:hypothetical protein
MTILRKSSGVASVFVSSGFADGRIVICRLADPRERLDVDISTAPALAAFSG